MNDLHAMKGHHAKLITVATTCSVVDLISFADGSLGVVRGSQLIGIWEPHEKEACISSFIQVVAPSRDPDVISELTSALLRISTENSHEIYLSN